MRSLASLLVVFGHANWRSLGSKVLGKVARTLRPARAEHATRHSYGPFSIELPPGHLLPLYQTRHKRYDRFLPHLAKLRKSGREVILCGDWNIAHQPIDLKNWRSNQKNSGFLPEERAWLSHLFDGLGFVDVFRKVDPRPEQFTWWSNRGDAWANNVGWRIDYQIATPGIAARARTAAIYKNRRFSDHAPLIIDYDYTLR